MRQPILPINRLGFSANLTALRTYYDRNFVCLFQEWNHFFENFAEVEFCVLGNQTEDTITTTAEPKLSDTLLKLHDKVLKTTPPPIDEHVV